MCCVTARAMAEFVGIKTVRRWRKVCTPWKCVRLIKNRSVHSLICFDLFFSERWRSALFQLFGFCTLLDFFHEGGILNLCTEGVHYVTYEYVQRVCPIYCMNTDPMYRRCTLWIQTLCTEGIPYEYRPYIQRCTLWIQTLCTEGVPYEPYEYIPYVQMVYHMNTDPMYRGCTLWTLWIQTLCTEGLPMNTDPMYRGCTLWTLWIHTICTEGVPYEYRPYVQRVYLWTLWMHTICTEGVPYEYRPYVQRVLPMYPISTDPMYRGCTQCTLSIQTLCAEGVPYEPHQYTTTTTTNDDDNNNEYLSASRKAL